MKCAVRVAIAGMVVACAAFAGDPTPDDFALRILPAQIVLPDSPDALASVELAVTLHAAVEGVQGWSFGILAEKSGLAQFFIENAWEHPDLAVVAGEALTLNSLVPGRPSFDVINFYREGHLSEIDLTGGSSINPTTSKPNPAHDSAVGIPGTWAAVIQGCVLDFAAKLSLPSSEDFGVLALRVKVQGQAPNSGRLVFSDAISTPPVDVVVAWNGQSYDPQRKGDDIYIPPAVQAPSTISFGAAAAQFIRGDCNDDGELTIADPIAALTYLFGKGPLPACLDALDANDEGRLDIADPVALLSYLFAHGATPSAPFEACGLDPTKDSLGCQAFAKCPPGR